MKKFPLFLLLLSFSAFAQEENRFDQPFEKADIAFTNSLTEVPGASPAAVNAVLKFMEENKYSGAAKEAAELTDQQPEVKAFEKQLQEDLNEIQRKVLDPLNKETDIDTITTLFRVVFINGESAKITSSAGGKNFKISVNPEINPFGYVLAVDREYTISIEVDKNLMYDLQTRGQTGTVEARMLWFAVSKYQLGRDVRQMQEYMEEEPGYDRSPRHH
ncbi:hypothetical protein RM549_06245 [Salegentibacter sp. F188]|uniref:DUF4468 domain-containing protein n=1 Tax=Autumnicola patrickiae TaxID=3075591 RepID=A0ABU3E052_9FLAO|nr:hypothetical protein [Salegentibacter sp. F188]MDT0689378.1 hypothetical protein [Salegentibacter sp. F188]